MPNTNPSTMTSAQRSASQIAEPCAIVLFGASREVARSTKQNDRARLSNLARAALRGSHRGWVGVWHGTNCSLGFLSGIRGFHRVSAKLRAQRRQNLGLK